MFWMCIRIASAPQHMILQRNIEKKFIFIILIPTPDFPHFYYMLGRNLVSLLCGDVSVMKRLMKETSWMHRLGTVCPFGLDPKIMFYVNIKY